MMTRPSTSGALNCNEGTTDVRRERFPIRAPRHTPLYVNCLTKPSESIAGNTADIIVTNAKSLEAGSSRVRRGLQYAYFGIFPFTAFMNSMNARNLLGMWARFA